MTMDSETPSHWEQEEPGAALVRSIRSLFSEDQPASGSEVAGSGDLEPDVLEVDAPPPAEAPAESPPPAESDSFRDLAERFLSASAPERAELENRVRARGWSFEEEQDLEALVDGVVVLARDGDPAALELAREFTTPAAAGALAGRIGRERDPDVRDDLCGAAARLADLMAPALAEALEEASDRGARRVLMEALGELDGHGRAQAERMLDDPRWFVARNGAALLARFGGEEAVAQLTGALGHDDPRVRREAVLALARIEGEDAEMLLMGMLEDSDLQVRTAAVRGLGVLKAERAVRPLLELLEEAEDEDLLVEVIRALGALGDPGVVPALEKRARGTLFSRSATPVRVAAYRALANVGTPHAVEVVREGRDDRNEEVRETARSLVSADAPAGEAEE